VKKVTLDGVPGFGRFWLLSRISHNELPKKKRPPQVAASLFSSSPLRDVAYCTKPTCHPVKRMFR
jgi:hypothetical protein